METPDEMLAEIMSSVEGFEGYSLHHFRVYRETRDGSETQGLDVTVKVSDGSNPRTRYSVSFELENGARVSGNPGDTLHAACYILRMSPHLK
jgi:hypothetical protein